MSPPPRVIIVRMPNWLGDTVMALPALGALRTASPDARVVAVGRWADLVAGQAVADVLVAYPRTARERLALGRGLRLDPPDLAILFPNSLESAAAAWWWRATRRVGFDTDQRRSLLTDAVARPSPRSHQVDEYTALVEAAGIGVDGDRTPRWKLPDNGAMEAEVDALLAGAGIPAGAKLVGLHLGAGFGPSKVWPLDSYRRLAAALRTDGFTPLLLGAADDRAAAESVSSGIAPPVPSLVGRDRRALVPRLLRRLSCLVSGDTGVAHLAAALGVPTVTLFGPTDPRLTAPRGARARSLYRAAPCSPCFLSVCPIDHICLGGIAVEDVAREIREAAA